MDLEIGIQQRVLSKIYALVYLSAFLSNYVQISGLWGGEGILPADPKVSLSSLTYFTQCSELLSSFIPSLQPYSTAETLLFIATGLGITLSLLSFCFKHMENSLTFLILWVLYFISFSIGDTFLSFQWDTLLLESGFLMIFYVKFPLGSGFGQIQITARELIKWLLFRYFFGSGIVKLMSECPTWWSLTALYYHYETQCLPTPLSWYFHQFPQIFQRFSVAFTYFVLIFTPFLFFVPIRSLRIFAGCLQVFQQLLILATGNYNFFNIMSIGLLFVMFDDSSLWFLSNIFQVQTKKQDKESLSAFFLLGMICILFFFGFVVPASSIIEGKMTFNKADLVKYVILTQLQHPAFTLFLTAIPVLLLINPLKYFRAYPNPLIIPSLLLIAILYTGSLIPFMTGIELNPSNLLFPHFSTMEKSYSMLAPYHISNSYGLFRRMTGVGGRPELIISASMDGKVWKEYVLPYKPQDLKTAPKFNFPHQPRLDWQMWFAALSDIHHSYWFFTMLNRLFAGSPSVLSLFQHVPYEKPKYIKVDKYLYWFTEEGEDWWKRKYVGEWLSPIQAGKELVAQWNKLGYPDPNKHKSHPLHPFNSIPVVGISIALITSKLSWDLYFLIK